MKAEYHSPHQTASSDRIRSKTFPKHTVVQFVWHFAWIRHNMNLISRDWVPSITWLNRCIYEGMRLKSLDITMLLCVDPNKQILFVLVRKLRNGTKPQQTNDCCVTIGQALRQRNVVQWRHNLCSAINQWQNTANYTCTGSWDQRLKVKYVYVTQRTRLMSIQRSHDAAWRCFRLSWWGLGPYPVQPSKHWCCHRRHGEAASDVTEDRNNDIRNSDVTSTEL